jgi:hypothetical protein
MGDSVGEIQARRQAKEEDEPMSTPEDLNMLSISYHIPGIGFLGMRRASLLRRCGTACRAAGDRQVTGQDTS